MTPEFPIIGPDEKIENLQKSTFRPLICDLNGFHSQNGGARAKIVILSKSTCRPSVRIPNVFSCSKSCSWDMSNLI